MKRITLELSDEAWAKINTAFTVRAMSGNAYGALDAFVMLILKAIDDGVEVKTINTREEREEGSNT